MDLSDRLKAVADMVSFGHNVADVGCDHAYISIYLIKNKISNKVIAMDVNEGPLKIARNNISKEGLDGKIETRLSDGLEKLSANEVDAVLIAGMGGDLTCKILQEGGDKLHKVKELILQPQSDLHKVRKLVERLGFVIVKEKMLIDDEKYYVVIKAVNRCCGDVNFNTEYIESDKQETHYIYGKYLLDHQNPVLHQYLLNRKQAISNIKYKLGQAQTINANKRLKEINRQLEYISIALSYY